METSIVCGVDGSDESAAALAVAAGIAGRLRARLVLAHVTEPALVPSVRAAPFRGMSMPGPLAAQEEALAHEKAGTPLLEEAAAAAGVADTVTRLVIGVPAERLAEIADDERAEMIVVGSRGRGAFKAAFLGSVSTSLVGIARCPVLVVPPGATAP